MPKILIVDDDETITHLMDALVKMEGHESFIVNDSTQAMEVARSVEPDLITLDLMMPGLSGYDLCELLLKEPKFSDVPIIIISAKDDSESRQTALAKGARDYITKPFNVDEFLEKINTLVVR